MDTPEGSMFSLRSTMFVVPILAMMLSLSCSRPSIHNGASSLDQDADPWEKQAWIDKTARALRFGNGISPTDQVDTLAAKPREEIVDILMQDPRFIETVLDFNLYFLNFKKHGQLRSEHYFIMPQALTAAKAVATNGDYFSLFDYDQPFYISNFTKPRDGFNGSMNTTGAATAPPISDREQRLAQLNKALAGHDEITALFKPTDDHTLDPQAHCSQFSDKFNEVLDSIYNSGLPDELVTAFSKHYLDVQIICFIAPDKLDPQSVYQTLLGSRDNYSKLMAIVDHPAASNYNIIASAAGVLAIDPTVYGAAGESGPFTSTFWNALPNSSTNSNRRRAAYILKTYFCDDLTPVNIALPTSHGDHKHAADPACAACHYKLDPMAGFFRYRGFSGIDFETRDFLIFDDAAIVSGSKLTDTLGAWRAPPDSGGDSGADTDRTWNIGYIRSAKKTELNSYGDSLRDLTKIFREAKEVRQCLTRRMAEYFLGKDQVYDGAWINSLATKFDDAAASTDPAATSKAFKAIAKDLVLSKTFMMQDPQQNQCYDFVPGHQPTTLPCEVAFVIHKNCSSCHSGDGAAGNLDLTKWQLGPGDSYNFAHTDDGGQQLSKDETFKRLLDRLSSNDESKLMPLNKFMSATERAQLYKWVSHEAAHGGH